MDGKIVGCQIGDTNFAETDGFGARWKEPARAEAFIGLSAFGGDTIEAITGATVTSKAVLAASNDVLKCISHVLGKDVEGDVLAFGVKEEKPAQTVELTGDVHQGKAVGFGNGEVTARLTLNDDGTIAALVIDASTQTPGFGTRCADEEFTAQVIALYRTKTEKTLEKSRGFCAKPVHSGWKRARKTAAFLPSLTRKRPSGNVAAVHGKVILYLH